MCSILAFMHLYSTFKLRLLLSIFLNILETPDRNTQWYQWSPNFIAIFYESNTEAGTNFRSVFYIYVMCMFVKALK